MIDFEGIKKLLPHRYPFLLIDRILEMEPGKRVVALKNVSANEWFFPGHFPEEAVMPGVLVVEGMAQAGAALAAATLTENIGKNNRLYYFGAINKFRFKERVLPGDQLIYELKVVRFTATAGILEGTATVDGKLVAKGEIVFGSREN